MSDESGRESWGPYPLILAGAVVAVAVMFFIDPRWGGFALGAVLMVGAALRFSGYGGQLAIRSKRTDVVILGVGGFVVVLTSLILENDALKGAILSLFGG